MARRSRILGIGVDKLTLQQLFERLVAFVREGGSRQIAYVNVDCVNRALSDHRYRTILKEADMVYADGMGVVWASRIFGEPLPQRLTLGDFFPELCALCCRAGFRLYVVAGKAGVAEEALSRVKERFPLLQIAGCSDGFFEPHQEAELIRRIREAKPDILLVGMGAPRQEKWIWQHGAQLGVPVMWGVGALFDYYAGRMPRAPVWMRLAGLEWFFRLCAEPWRLWRRYLVGNFQFAVRAGWLLLVDAFLVTAAWLGTYAMRRQLNDAVGMPINAIEPYFRILPGVITVWLVAAAAFGLYRRGSHMSLWNETRQAVRATALGLVITMAVAFLFKEFELGRSIILPFGVSMLVLLALSRMIARRWERWMLLRYGGLRKALVIGTGDLARRLKQEVELAPAGYDVVGFVGAGSLGDLPGIIRQRHIHDVFFASQSLGLQQMLNLLDSRMERSVNYHVVSKELELFSSRVPLRRMAQLPVLPLPLPQANPWYERAKRLGDMMIAFAGLVLTAPLLVLVACVLRCESSGKIIFFQQRIGREGKPFGMWKFRTMKAEADPYDMAPNDLSDPRVTAFGRFLRRWSLDELPQLVNVLQGHMSIVGPRPEMSFLVEKYEPWQRRRLAVKPGLTCLWQVIGRKELPLHTNLEYDLYYIHHRGWKLDTRILLRTIPAVLFRRGAF